MPSSALDPLAMLATGIDTQPGVYGLLLGSGVSTGAGIPTGWGVVQSLIRRLAAATEPQDATAPDRAAQDPEGWWAEHGDGAPLGYSNLLAAVAPTPAARRALLAGFFEPDEDDTADGLKVPSPAHRAIANLVKRGLVKVIVTTNFDRLTERALEDAGVPPQVLSRPEAVAGLTPLPHAPATVIKLHGDYAELDMRNTLEELTDYPPAWDTLLDRVFDEYGLLISGWSADWDKALVAALQRTKTRRYPLYWDSRSSQGETARRLLAQQHGIVVPTASADDLFTDLVSRVDALDRLTEQPLTSALAVARLKRYLPDPVRRIDLSDVVLRAVTAVVDTTTALPVHRSGLDGQVMEDLTVDLLTAAEPTLRLLSTGVFYDRDRQHTDLWVDGLQRLLTARGPINGMFQDVLDQIRHYPALLALRGMGIIAVHTGRDDVLLRLLHEPTWRDPFGSRTRLTPAEALHDYQVMDGDLIRALPRWKKVRLAYPMSHMLRQDLRDILRPLIPDDGDYRWACDRYEYRVALAQHLTPSDVGHAWVSPGEFIGDNEWDRDGRPITEAEFQARADQADDAWPWWPVVGGSSGLPEALSGLRETLRSMRRRR